LWAVIVYIYIYHGNPTGADEKNLWRMERDYVRKKRLSCKAWLLKMFVCACVWNIFCLL